MFGSATSSGVGGAQSETFVIEGDRRCFRRYEDDDSDRGGAWRPMPGDRGPSSLYEELRLSVGLLDFEDAGDCWAGGV